jgi:hypothetical protein
MMIRRGDQAMQNAREASFLTNAAEYTSRGKIKFKTKVRKNRTKMRQPR